MNGSSRIAGSQTIAGGNYFHLRGPAISPRSGGLASSNYRNTARNNNESGEFHDNEHTDAGDLPGVYLRDGVNRLTCLSGNQ
ncbi:hypothetical protein D3C80_1519720 [compost metagenome]